jgi:hypothetical protein
VRKNFIGPEHIASGVTENQYPIQGGGAKKARTQSKAVNAPHRLGLGTHRTALPRFLPVS